jgi:hypothetical protein
VSEGIEMRLSFWPSGIIGAKARVFEMLVQPAELAGLCNDPKAHCPMGCFSCPFGEEKKCAEVTTEEWTQFFFDKEDGSGEKSST